MIKVHRMLHTSSLLKPGDGMSFSSWEWVSSSVYINLKKKQINVSRKQHNPKSANKSSLVATFSRDIPFQNKVILKKTFPYSHNNEIRHGLRK